MDNFDFFNLFDKALANDTAIAAWCSSNFSKSLTVFSDVQSESLPNRDDMPYALIHTPGVIKHQDRRLQQYAISVDVALNKDSMATTGYTNLSRPAGIELIMDVCTLIVNAFKAVLPTNTTMGYNLSADTLGALPEVHGYLDFDFTVTLTLGSDPLA